MKEIGQTAGGLTNVINQETRCENHLNVGAIFVLIILAALECFEIDSFCVESEHPKFKTNIKQVGLQNLNMRHFCVSQRWRYSTHYKYTELSAVRN